MSTVYTKEGIVHSPERTAIAAKTMIVRKRWGSQWTN